MDRETIINLSLILAWVLAISLVAMMAVAAVLLGSRAIAQVAAILGVAWFLILLIVTSFLKKWSW